MGIDLSLIIPNQCRSLKDKEHATEYFYHTIDKVVSYFRGHKQFISDIIVMPAESDTDTSDYSFYLPILDITAYMRAGYWDVWTAARYSHYFHPYGTDMLGNPYIWLRTLCFNTLLAFGQTEGWICDDFHSWNCELPENEESSFEDWLNNGDASDDRIVYEYNLKEFFMEERQTPIEDSYASKYHDDYKECHILFEEVKKRFPDYKILFVDVPLPYHAFVAKGKDLYILNIKTGESLTVFPIDNCRANFNGAGFQIFRGEESAFFSRTGKQLTEYRVGDFSCDWDTSKGSHWDQIVTDKATGKQYVIEDP